MHILFKLKKIKDKEKILKKSRGKNYLTYREAMIRMISDCSSETMQRDKTKYLVVKEKKNHQFRILHLVKSSFKSNREIKTFLGKQKLE